MSLYSGRPIIGRIFASEIWGGGGAYFREGLFGRVYLIIFFFGGGGVGGLLLEFYCCSVKSAKFYRRLYGDVHFACHRKTIPHKKNVLAIKLGLNVKCSFQQWLWNLVTCSASNITITVTKILDPVTQHPP